MNKLLFRSAYIVFIVASMLLISCAAQKESVQAPTTIHTGGIPLAEEPLSCEEVTSKSTNLSGIESMPFMRASFTDIDGSGRQDMVIGNKNGNIFLYRNTGNPATQPWRQIYGYFGDIRAGAVSSPVLADLDDDGKAELIVGTGGFSSESGKILFFTNKGSADSPDWKRNGDIGITIGKDAAVAVVDYNFDGKPDIIAGNSEGKLFFFRNMSTRDEIRFVWDHSPLAKTNFGMYAVPAATKIGNRVILVVGNSMGKMVMYEIRKNGHGLSSHHRSLGIRTNNFASPAFTNLLEKGRVDLVVADGDGMINYYENKNGDFSSLKKINAVFNNRLFAGPVCAPTLCTIRNRTFMVVGNMDGIIRLFERDNSVVGLPWAERPGHFSGIKVEGFSRGLLTEWEGREMLITGQGDGRIRAFVNGGGGWKESPHFFEGVKVKEHSTPVIFDAEGNGKWTLITGSGSGKIYAFSIKEIRHGAPVWERVEGVLDNVKVSGFSAPTVVKDEKAVYLFVGQRDGRIRIFRADASGRVKFSSLRFTETGFLSDIRMNEHSSPFVQLNNGVFDIMSGDYSGNLRHFICKNTGY